MSFTSICVDILELNISKILFCILSLETLVPNPL